MIAIQKDSSLAAYNTFRVNQKATYFAEINSENDLTQLLSHKEFSTSPQFILGGGSNTLFTDDYEGIVIKSNLKGISIEKETDDSVYLNVAAGEDWPTLVKHAVDNNWGGIENLALIPGLMGAAPVQNIAAYGGNFVDVFEQLYAFNLKTGEKRVFTEKECEFGYRDSVFKNKLKGQYMITSVTIQLKKNPKQLETSYFQIHINRDSIQDELRSFAKQPYSIRDVYQAVVNIRTRKLPDASVTPTVGSFFLNPTVTKEKLRDLQKEISELQFYPLDNLNYKDLHDPLFDKEKFVKIPAGRLLQELGWLGKWEGNVGVHDKHSLIIVTNGKASGKEILDFSQKMKESVTKAYDIQLQTEINIL